MAGNFVDSLVIGIGLDTSQIAQGVQQVGAQLDSGLSAAAQSAASKMSPLGEALKGLSQEAEKFKAPVKEDIRSLDKLEHELKTELPQAAHQGFAGAESAAGKFKSFISSIWAQISGPLLGAFAIGGTISSYISNATAAGELADKLKVDIEEIQIWSGAMERAGGSASGLQSTIEKLNASGKANGDVFGTLLGLAEKAETMTKEAFTEYAKKLEIDEKTIEVLQQGKKALEEHLKKQEELGVYTKEDAEQSKKFKQALADLLKAWDSLTAFLGRFALPVMEEVAKIFTELVAYLRKHPAFVAAAIALVGGALTAKLLPPLKALPAIIANVSKAFMRWFPFVAVIMALALVIEDFWVYLHGGKSALEDVWKVFGTGPELLAKFKAAWEGLKDVIKTVWEGIKQFASYLGELAKASGWLDGLKNAFKGVAQIFKGLFSGNAADIGKGLGTLVRGLGQMVIGAFKGIGTMIKDLFKNLFKFDGGDVSISGVMDAIWNAITGTFDFLWDFIKSFWEGVFDIELPSLDELGTKIWNTITKIFDDLTKKVTDFFKNLFKDFKLPSISDLFKGASDAAGKAGDVLGKGLDLAKGAAGKGLDLLGGLLGAGAEGAAKVGEKLGPMLKEGMGLASEAVGKGFDFFKGLLGDAKDGASKVGASLGPMLSEGLNIAKEGLGKAKNFYADFYGTIFGTAKDGAAKVGEMLGPALQGGLDIAQKGLSAAGDFFKGIFGDAQPATDEAGGKIEDGMGKTAGAVRDAFNAAWQATAGYGVQAFQSAAVTIQQIFAGIVSGIETQVGNLVAGVHAMGAQGGMVPAFAGVRAQQGGSRNISNTQNNKITIHAPGGDPRAVQQGVQRGLSQSNKTMPAQSGTVPKG
jgi:phage-related protein